MSRMTSLRAAIAGGRAAACADDPERMYPLDESERPGQRTVGEARALEVCARCPVLAECRRDVLGLDGPAPLPYGVAGGMTREDRRAVRAASRRLSREAATGPAAWNAAGSALSQPDSTVGEAA